MRKRFRTIRGQGKGELTERKSRFIGHAKRIDTEESAGQFINEVRNEHRDANHNAFAYICGDRGEQRRFSDDGEPSGTAGKPVLQMIQKEELRDIVVVVTRYFGGIRLGTGGLVRAYTRAASAAVSDAGIISMGLFFRIRIRVQYPLLGSTRHLLEESEKITITKINYSDIVEFTVMCPFEDREWLKERMTDISSGNAGFMIEGQEFMEMPGNEKERK